MTLVKIADEVGDLPFRQLISFSVLPLASSHSGVLGGTVLLCGTDRRFVDCSFPSLSIHVLQQTQVESFKKGASNSATQDLIMNARNKTQFTYARINCVLKDSNCDTPSPKIFMLTIPATCDSSSSTKISKCPSTKNDSIFTHRYESI
ncbi:hypothetical protein H5410_003703 [Solanum commersonii]|uniref:Uncharacterized protein n=1 Tax=Solanum commersonii TaxID=4109 RepID=A0A9J6B5U9_SOLCO|nr:hypothetical protein H5410_003703 [Solanum commersonii]